ncbi:MAG: HAMP domain-containing sensor histidine kinase [Myxococcota bacterium]|jgi:signal transduction histidine kinase|nr:HAMP domain-containing sensor histidine kinase [Myxococcota bacterium]
MSGTAAQVRDTRGDAEPCVNSSAMVLCRDGKIVWASDAAAERLTGEGAPTFMGACLESTLRKWGQSIDQGPGGEILAWRRPGEEDALPRFVRVERLALPDALFEAASGHELCVLTDLPGGPRQAETNLDDVDRLERANKEIKQDRDELIATLSHELRTPLTVISGYSKLLLSEQAGELNDDQRRYLESTRASCERLNDFVVDLLDASHDHGGAICLRLERLPIEGLIRQVIEFFAPAFEENDIGVEIDVASGLADAHFDAARIEQVLTNLIGNAIKYTTPESAIRIAASGLERSGTPGIEVSVSDQGPGIAQDDRVRIFEPYVRGRRSKSAKGVGLGLAICRRILEAHRGTIGVEAVPGGGSRFHFWIPARGRAARGES